jgi:hypothetical protein
VQVLDGGGAAIAAQPGRSNSATVVRERYRARKRERNQTSELAKASMAAGSHRRRARKRNALPPNADRAAINRAFRKLAIKAHGLGLHIDHKVPIAGSRVCGERGMLVPSNWQLLSRSDNSSKSNRCMTCWVRPIVQRIAQLGRYLC